MQATLGIFGSGKTGQLCAQYGLDQGHRVTLFDQKNTWQPKTPSAAFTCRVGETLCKEDLTGIDEVIVSPGMPFFHPWIQSLEAWGIPYGSDIDFVCQRTEIPIVGVTGTNGKSTVCTLLQHTARILGLNAYAGGNLGPPAVALLAHKNADLWILELSSAQLAYSKQYRLKVGLILNIGEDHLDWHQTQEHYQKSKLDMASHAEHAILPDAYEHFFDKAEVLMKKCDVLIPFENVAAAMAVGDVLGWPEDIWSRSLASFEGLQHRLSPVESATDIVWYNDSKGTNFAASAFACKTLHAQDPAPFWWIAGGLFKTLDLTLMDPWLKNATSGVIVFGSERHAFVEKIRNQYPSLCLLEADTMEEAVVLAHQHAASGERILFSPGGTSFDAFANYEVRGNAFMDSVGRLEGKPCY